ncbi:MAG: hypothetical protein PHP54_00810 [Clostridia bacterium]|nr:hypothetical protein [Clostridia bacterium]
MGIFDRFKKRKNKNVKETMQQEEANIILPYSPERNGGIYSAEINFNDGMENIDGKNLKAVNIKYNYEMVETGDTQVFCKRKNVYLEPYYDIDENGNTVENTEQYYNNLINNGKKADVKGFFRIQDIERIDREGNGNNYIGYLSYDQDEKAERLYDMDFKKNYIKKLKEEKLRNNEQKQENFKKELNSLSNYKANDGYKNWLDNEDDRFAGRKKLDDKTIDK